MKYIDLWLRADTLRISANALSVLRHLVLASTAGQADVRVDAAAPIIGLSVPSIYKHIRDLYSLGYVVSVWTRRGADARSTYRLDIKQMLERAVAAGTMTSAQAQEAYASMMRDPDRVCPAPSAKAQHPQSAPAPAPAPTPKAKP